MQSKCDEMSVEFLTHVSVQPDAWAPVCQCITKRCYFHKSDPSRRAVSGVGKWQLACCRDCGFESPRLHGCLL